MPEAISNPLLELIKDRNLLDDLQLEEVLQEHSRSGKKLEQILHDFGLIDRDAQLQIMADHLGTEVVQIQERDLTPEVLAVMPGNTARMYQCLPLAIFDSTVRVALADPLNPAIVDELGFITRREVQLVVADAGEIEKAINKFYGESNESVADILKELGADGDIAKEVEELETSGTKGLIQVANETPIVKFVNLVIFQAVQDRASDIHFEPFEDEFKIRYRVDGALYEMAPPPKHLALPVISRIKVMANLNISERRLPQDGRISMPVGNKQIDLRVSTLPTQFGESVVLRILDRSAVNLDLAMLGLPKTIHEYISEAIQQPNGIFVVTGPTGSGKTTTLYSALAELNQMADNISTAEDPVEFNLAGINQVNVKKEIGLTFAVALKAFLRQDPDIIMVGEIRDHEVAEIAIEAALTGHLVLSTLHTNDAPATISRLLNMGIEPFLLMGSLNVIVAQRLCRKICTNCKEPHEIPVDHLIAAGIAPASAEKLKTFRGKGCEICNQSGYKGRVAIYEVLPITPGVKDVMLRNGSSDEIKKQAIKEGMKTLRMCALTKVAQGLTTLEEALGNSASDKFS